MEPLLREIADAGLSSREGCGNTVRNVTGDPWAGVAADEIFDPTPYAGRLRPLLRPPPDDAADAAQDQDRLHRLRRRPRDHRHPRHRLHRPRSGTASRASRSGSAAAPRSWPASRRPSTSSSRPTTATTSRSPRPSLRIFDRQDWLRVNRARARIKVLVDKIGIDAFREHGRRGARGRLGRRARIRPEWSSACASTTTRRPTPPRRPPPPPRRTATAPSSSASSKATSRPQRQEGFSTVEVKVIRGDLTPEQFRGLGADHARVHRRLRPQHRAAELRPALGPRRGALRRLAAARRARPRRGRRRARSPTSSAAPAPTAASSGSPARWA